jgi:hypothetical protein
LASQTVPEGSNPDEETAPSGFEQGQLGLGGGSGGTVEREYIWGPGDNGFDELLVQYDAGGHEAWAIQDGGGDLVALCDLKGLDNQGSPSIARVVGQWTYDAYGEVLSAEHLFAFSLPRLGHKGLFLDRLDGSAAGPRLVPFGHGLYHMRNRAYAPGLGRFLQRDPNQTAMALAESAAMHGRGLGSLAMAFDLEGLYGDGGNLYEYLGGNPWQRHDTLGLSWDPFDMVDDYLAEDAGSKAAFFERVIGTARAAAYIGAVIASTLPIPLPVGVAAFMAADALEGRVPPELAQARKVLGYVMLTGFVARIGAAATRTGIHYVQQYGMRGAVTNLRTATVGIAKNAWAMLQACGCFEAGTGVWTARGYIPIEEVRQDDQVLARDELTGETVLRRVLYTYIRLAAPIVEVAVVSESGGDGTLRTTEEHPLYTADRGWVGVIDLQPGDVVSTATGDAVVRLIVFTGEVAPVYNLEVEGVHDYFVGDDGVLVHNGLRACWLWAEHHLIPAYMGGWRLLGSTERLYNRDHVLIHRLIDDAARAAGAPLMNEGRKAIRAYLRDHGAQGIQTLKQVLINGVGAYDRQKGTNLLSKLLNELARQGW